MQALRKLLKWENNLCRYFGRLLKWENNLCRHFGSSGGGKIIYAVDFLSCPYIFLKYFSSHALYWVKKRRKFLSVIHFWPTFAVIKSIINN